MFNIGQFFKRTQSKYTWELFTITVVKDAIQKLAGVELPIENISFNGQSVVLKNLSQAAQSHIFIKKQPIIEEINTQQNLKKINNIR